VSIYVRAEAKVSFEVATIHNILPLSRMSREIDVYSDVFCVFSIFYLTKTFLCKENIETMNHETTIFAYSTSLPHSIFFCRRRSASNAAVAKTNSAATRPRKSRDLL